MGTLFDNFVFPCTAKAFAFDCFTVSLPLLGANCVQQQRDFFYSSEPDKH